MRERDGEEEDEEEEEAHFRWPTRPEEGVQRLRGTPSAAANVRVTTSREHDFVISRHPNGAQRCGVRTTEERLPPDNATMRKLLINHLLSYAARVIIFYYYYKMCVNNVSRPLVVFIVRGNIRFARSNATSE